MTHSSANRFYSAYFLFACFVSAPFSAAAQTESAKAEPAAPTEISPTEIAPTQVSPTEVPSSDSGLPGDMDPTAGGPIAPGTVQTVSPLVADLLPKIDPVALYGDNLKFDVYRKGSKIGTHQATFARNGDELIVTSQMELAVDVLFFTAYKFEYDSTEVWRDNQLVSVAATVNDNGKISKTNARVADGMLTIDGPRGTYMASSWVFPTNHWHRGQANSGTILNTLNGKLNKVQVVHKGIERVETAQGSVDADHLAYTGDLRDTDVWYDSQNRWVQMRFKAKDGSAIEYRCLQCGLAPGVPATIANQGGATEAGAPSASAAPAATPPAAAETVQ